MLGKPQSKFIVKFKNTVDIKIVCKPSFATNKCRKRTFTIPIFCVFAACNAFWEIFVDAMGGDNAPHEIIKGAVEAVKERKEIQVCLIGKRELITHELSQFSYPKDQIRIEHAQEAIETAEPPVLAIRKKKQSSIVIGMNMVKQKEMDAFISAGSSGAVLVGGQVIVGRIKGIERPHS